MAEKKSRDPRLDNSYLALVADIRGVVERWIAREVISNARAAEEANVNPRTLSKFLAGETMAPQLLTLHKLVRAADAEFLIREAGREPRRLGRKRKGTTCAS